MRKELKKLLVGMIRKAVREVVREEIGKRKVTHITIDHLIGQLSLSTVANEQPNNLGESLQESSTYLKEVVTSALVEAVNKTCTLLETPQKGDPDTIQVEKRH